jgi:hypothetical protein
MKTRRIKYSIFILALGMFSACELINGPELSPPADVSASTELPDKIELTWTEIEKANIYYIYRSDTEGGEYEYAGFTYAGSYTDTDIAPEIPYWYRVTASDLETNNESGGSTPVRGTSDHEFAWSQPAVAGTGAAQARLAIDTGDGSVAGTAYLAYAANDETGAVTVSKYDRANGTFEVLGGALGTTDIDSPRVFDIAADSGTVYLAYSDKGLSGQVTVKAYSPAAGTWQTLGSEGFSTGTAARYVSIDIDPSTGTVYVGYIDSSGFEVRNGSDGFENATGIPGTPDPDDTTALISFDGTLIRHAFEDVDSSSIIAPAGTAAATGVNLRDGYMDFIAASASEMYITYYTDALSVKQYDGSWADITPAGASAAVSAASVALARDPSTGSLYLFYSDDGGGFGASGLVMRYSSSGWTTLVVDEDTDSIATAPSSVELEAYNNIVYASYLTGGAATLRVWE